MHIRLVLAGILALFVAIVGFGSIYTVGERERGVVVRNGAVTGVAGPGMGLKIPIIDGVVDVPVDTRVVTFDKLQAYSRDQQPADFRVSVIFSVPPGEVREVYSRFRDVDGLIARIIQPKVMEQAKNVFGQYTAVSAVQDRVKLNADIAAAIHAAVKGLDALVLLEAVQVENVDFSDTYEKSIEQRMLAEVEVQKTKQNAEREKVTAQMTVIKAQAAADATLAAAEANAKATRIQGEAEATAIKARGDALRENPKLVELTQAERWNGQLPATMVPGGAVPMLNLGGGR